MRCVAGVHMQASRQRAAIPAKQEYRRFTPSLRMSECTKNPVSVGAVSADIVEPARVVRAVIGTRRKRRSLCKDESPRSGLLPYHTLEGTRSRSDYGMVTNVQRLEEQLKLSDYGLLSPIAIPSTLVDTSKPPPCIRTSTAKHTACTKWKSRFRQRFSTWSKKNELVLDEVHPMMAPTTSTKAVAARGINCFPKSKSITFFVPTTERSPISARRLYHVSSRTDDTTEVVSPRRNSVFVKRGSVSMEPIQKVNIEDVYSVYKQLGTGRFGYIKLAEHKQSGQRIAIKFFPRPQTKQVDFIREYNYSFFLSPHPHIVDTYQGMHQTGDESAFFFVQEFCPRASLREAVEATNQQGIGEANTKMVFSAVLSAVEFMHSENLVHRNLKAENILLFDSNDFSKAKITDFGLTRKVDSAVKYLEYVNNYHAPELCETVVNEMLTVNKSIDIWALGVIFYYCLRGRFPWQKASIMCKQYWEWEQWLKRKNPTLPKRWMSFSEKALKLLKKTLTARVKDRWSAKDMRKFIIKEKLLKPIKTDSGNVFVNVPSEIVKQQNQGKEQGRKKSTLQHWISSTLSAMAEISEQVVSARDD